MTGSLAQLYPIVICKRTYPGCKVKVAQSCPALCDPMDYMVRGILQTQILEWVAFPFRGSSQPNTNPKPGIEPRSPTLQADSLPAEPPGKPKNIGLGSLGGSLLGKCALERRPRLNSTFLVPRKVRSVTVSGDTEGSWKTLGLFEVKIEIELSIHRKDLRMSPFSSDVHGRAIGSFLCYVSRNTAS